MILHWLNDDALHYSGNQIPDQNAHILIKYSKLFFQNYLSNNKFFFSKLNFTEREEQKLNFLSFLSIFRHQSTL